MSDEGVFVGLDGRFGRVVLREGRLKFLYRIVVPDRTTLKSPEACGTVSLQLWCVCDTCARIDSVAL